MFFGASEVKRDYMNRTLVWFSCGAASACAAKLSLERWPDSEVLYCDTLKYEHTDNTRFMRAIEQWIGRDIKILKSHKYTDIFDVFNKTGWLVGPGGARCTQELKRNVRVDYQQPGDRHIFGLCADELNRIERFEDGNPQLYVEWVLKDAKLAKNDCLAMLEKASIELPAMYLLGYNNNNCIGCVKGQSGYWNKIRKDFPETFERMAKQERLMNVAINKRYEGKKRIRVFLDELPENAGRFETEHDFDCGPQCVTKNL